MLPSNTGVFTGSSTVCARNTICDERGNFEYIDKKQKRLKNQKYAKMFSHIIKHQSMLYADKILCCILRGRAEAPRLEGPPGDEHHLAPFSYLPATSVIGNHPCGGSIFRWRKSLQPSARKQVCVSTKPPTNPDFQGTSRLLHRCIVLAPIEHTGSGLKLYQNNQVFLDSVSCRAHRFHCRPTPLKSGTMYTRWVTKLQRNR